MKVELRIAGGTFDYVGARFDYYCAECGAILTDAGQLEHPTHDGILFWKGNPINCPHAGKKCKKPKIVFDCQDLQ